MKARGKKRFYTLGTLFIFINLLVLALPIIGIASLRIFENVLHRQTESKLIAEASYIQALYLSALDVVLDGDSMKVPLVKYIHHNTPQAYGKWRPYPPVIDLWRDDVLPSPPDGSTIEIPINRAAKKAGRVIQPILEDAQRYNLSGSRVLDVNGNVIATTGPEAGMNLANRQEVREALSGNYSSVLRERVLKGPLPPFGSISRASRVRVFVAIPILEGERLAGVVYLHRTSLTFFRDLWERRFGAVLAIMFGATILISLVLTGIVTKPLKLMIRQAQRIAAGEKDVSLEIAGSAPVEAHQLSEALSTMVEKLRKRMEYVREFTRSVSHEFKTPLAGIQGSIELLNEGWETMTDQERARFISIIDQDVRRMERLVKRLIELTRIETAEPEEGAVADLPDIAGMVAHRCREAGHQVKLDVEGGVERAKMGPDMAETVISNLVDNAVTHGREKEVTVKVMKGPSVKVSDKGPGISDKNVQKIFDRFFTTNRNDGGTGLGLSIVKAICDMYDAEIKVESNEDGTAFTVEFKPAEPEGRAVADDKGGAKR